jgi:hypothetical protein
LCIQDLKRFWANKSYLDLHADRKADVFDLWYALTFSPKIGAFDMKGKTANP